MAKVSKKVLVAPRAVKKVSSSKLIKKNSKPAAAVKAAPAVTPAGNKLSLGQWISYTYYYNVQTLGSEVQVKDQTGNGLFVSKHLIHSMNSADHFAKEVQLTQTALASLLHEHAHDHVLKISFKKQVTAELAA